MRRREKEIQDRAEIEAILQSQKVVHLALTDGDQPYAVPMNFGYADGCLYLHSATEGKKLDLLAKNPRVGFEVTCEGDVVPGPKACQFSARYRCVMGAGQAVILSDPAEKVRALDILMSQFAPGPFDYDETALARVVVIRIDIESMTGKQSQ